jgi:hypothetical protein
MHPNDELAFTCSNPFATIGDEMASTYTVKCGVDGSTPPPEDWPECAVRCAIHIIIYISFFTYLLNS